MFSVKGMVTKVSMQLVSVTSLAISTRCPCHMRATPLEVARQLARTLLARDKCFPQQKHTGKAGNVRHTSTQKSLAEGKHLNNGAFVCWGLRMALKGPN